MKEKFYTCRYDRAFKEIMLNEKNKDILKSLLETTLKVKIEKLEIKPNERIMGNVNIKGKIFDVLVMTNIGKIQIEINANNEEYVHPRNTAYICDTYSHDTLVGLEYSEEIKYIQINLTYGIKDKKEVRKYYIMDEEGKKYVENFTIYEYNMDFYKKIWDNKDKKLIEKNKILIMLDLPLEELRILSKEDRMVNKYMENLENINKNPEFREYMSREEDLRKIRNSRLSVAKRKAREEGLEEGKKEGIKQGIKQGIEEGKKEGIKEGIEQGIEKGLEKGIKQGKIEIAKNMLNDGINIEMISKYTKIPIEKIKELQ